MVAPSLLGSHNQIKIGRAIVVFGRMAPSLPETSISSVTNSPIEEGSIGSSTSDGSSMRDGSSTNDGSSMRGGSSLNGLADLDLEGNASNYQAVIDALRTKLGRRAGRCAAVRLPARDICASPRCPRPTLGKRFSTRSSTMCATAAFNRA
jgi:hypothetical protein